MDEFERHSPTPRVVTIIRSVGPSSMPWNDLYGRARSSSPGTMMPPLQTGPFANGKIRRSWAMCGNRRRLYYRGGVTASMWYMHQIYRRCRAGGYFPVFHFHSPNLLALLLFAWIIKGTGKIIFTLHGDWQRFGLLQRVSLHLISHLADSFICVSKSATKGLPARVERHLHANRKLTWISNGVPVDQLDAEYPVPALGERRDNDVIVISRIVAVKSPEMVLDVFSRLKNAQRLIWFGSGPRDEIEEQAKRLGIDHRVELRGICPRREVIEALRNGSVYLSCAVSEGLPVAALEAAAMGCRPFLSGIPPHDEIAQVVGIPTFDLSDSQSWVDAIDDCLHPLCDSQPTAVDLARRAREVFDLRLTMRRYIELYESFATNARPGETT